MAALKAEGIVPVADIVINHRCADEKDEHTGVYNRFRWAPARWKFVVQPGSREQPLDISQKSSAEACKCPLYSLEQVSAYSCKGHAIAVACAGSVLHIKGPSRHCCLHVIFEYASWGTLQRLFRAVESGVAAEPSIDNACPKETEPLSSRLGHACCRDDINHKGEKIDWGQWAITGDDPDFGGQGSADTGDDYGPAPGGYEAVVTGQAACHQCTSC